MVLVDGNAMPAASVQHLQRKLYNSFNIGRIIFYVVKLHFNLESFESQRGIRAILTYKSVLRCLHHTLHAGRCA